MDKLEGGAGRAASGHRRAIAVAMAVMVVTLGVSQFCQWMIGSELHRPGVMRDSLILDQVDFLGISAAIIQIVCGIFVVAVLGYALRCARADQLARDVAIKETHEATETLQLLFRMTEMLQSASGYTDATAVLRATSNKLLPQFGGALYVFNNSRDRLDLCASWNIPEEQHPAQSIAPGDCWALKRGKPHLNSEINGGLCCEHFHSPGLWLLEIPMLARGEVYGLIQFGTPAEFGEARLQTIQPIAVAIADGMSLALANIGLREKLRSQALRDSLTGLYNRRYMEDMLERFGHLAERNKTPLSAIMIDLDHFKRLNDDHGHAAGDAVLRAVAATLMEGLRASDIACRYGGEELLLLLPDCSLEQARAKAESLRTRIEGLSEVYNASVSGSFGVACLFETTKDSGHLLSDADAALYQAKLAGRNQVVAAERRIELGTLTVAA